MGYRVGGHEYFHRFSWGRVLRGFSYPGAPSTEWGGEIAVPGPWDTNDCHGQMQYCLLANVIARDNRAMFNVFVSPTEVSLAEVHFFSPYSAVDRRAFTT